jgi:hypothetical protein
MKENKHNLTGKVNTLYASACGFVCCWWKGAFLFLIKDSHNITFSLRQVPVPVIHILLNIFLYMYVYILQAHPKTDHFEMCLG